MHRLILPTRSLLYACIQYLFVAFSIGRACRYAYLRDIRNPSRYALEFDFVLSLVNFRSNWLARLVDFPWLGEHLPSDSSVLIFASTLDKYVKFINELSVWIEGRCPPADHIPYDEDLPQRTLGFSRRAREDKETYPVSDVKRNRLATQLDSDKETESKKKSTSIVTIKRERQSTSQRLMEQFSKDE